MSKSVVTTGDPNCPSSVRCAKAICQLIIEKTEGVTGSEDELFSPNDMGELTENCAGNEGNEAAESEEAESGPGMPCENVSVSLLSIDLFPT